MKKRIVRVVTAVVFAACCYSIVTTTCVIDRMQEELLRIQAGKAERWHMNKINWGGECQNTCPEPKK